MSHTKPLPMLVEALRTAARQNSHDMLMTGEELRACEAALAAYDLGARSTAAQPADCGEAGHDEGRCGNAGCMKPTAQPVETLTPDVVEQRLLTWRQSRMNRSGDMLALDDFMDKESLDDLIDFVCAAPPAAAQPVEPTIPNGWVPLRIEWEPGYPEDVAFGPQIMMDRLKKWLDKHFATVIAAASGDSTPPSEPVCLRVPIEAISKLLDADMDRAVANGANSVSMPDELVEIAAWLDSVQGDPSGALRPEPEAVGQDRVRAWTEAPGAERVWTCKVGGPVAGIPNGGDSPMRAAVSQAFEQVTGFEARFIFSGWGGELTEGERAVVENRPAMPTFEVRVAGPDDVFSYSDELFALRHANSVNQAYLADRAKHPDSEVLCVATVHAAEPPQAASGERGD